MSSPSGLIKKSVWLAVTVVACIAAAALAGARDSAEQTAAGAPSAEPARVVVTPPSDPVAKKAFEALERRCGACHQANQLAPGGSAEGFANVLSLDEIAQDPALVLPGNPYGSRLFAVAIGQQPPHDTLSDGSGDPEDLAEDLYAIHDWIQSLDPRSQTGCMDRKLIDRQAVVSAIAADVEAQLGRRRKGMRYLTLSHLYNECASEPAISRFRQGAVKLLNSLSRGSVPIAIRTVDEANTILAFNLNDLQWTAKDWARLIEGYPYGVHPDTTLYDTLVGQTETPLPWLRADWFAYTASRAPLYYELLKLPVSFAELQQQLEIDVNKNIEGLLVVRAGLTNSTQSRHDRLVERHALADGFLWTTYDFRSAEPQQNLLKRPLGPAGENPFEFDDAQTLFNLPNGFIAYYLSDSEGRRQDGIAPELVTDAGSWDYRTMSAISCFGCHANGVRPVGDEIRKKLLADPNLSAEVREKVEALYKTDEEMEQLLNQDVERFDAAMRQAGLDPDLDSPGQGVESINALSRQYGKALGLRHLAAEFGIAPAALADALQEAGEIKIGLRRRLEQNAVPRRVVEKTFADLVAIVSDDEAVDLEPEPAQGAAAVETGPEPDPVEFDLALTSNKAHYKVGETPALTVSSERDCYLTLTRVGPKGRARVIFPNKSQRDNFLLEGTLFRFPPEKNPGPLRLNRPGRETVIASCNAEGAQFSGGEDEFKRMRRADLGDYRAFLTGQIKAAAGNAKTPARKHGAGEQSPPPIARTAITFDVE